ncbi:hypothetical protein L288_12540 [Sphingobium quisquiliarum P25]|uniref:HTH luxR-type domain-containing protein n=1 Tax=Sphingobium quisquiliarum P25 TaxID=1329909 RepID=T0GXP4_9SPHN|nr:MULTISPECIES: LuxR C-terminal-related transcriptional regulator [Sphingobium]EQB05467.1 hypothetical protein L288_12540 [Sphingobium quisquiliarum P25]
MESIGLETQEVRDETGPLRLLIVDPSALRRACMAVALESAGLKVTSLASMGDRSLECEADVILFQAGDGPDDAESMTEQIASAVQSCPGAAILVIADHHDQRLMLSAVAAGAHGVLTSNISLPRIQEALALLSDGLSIFPASVGKMIQTRLNLYASAGGGSNDRVRAAVDQLAALTRRQRDVLELLAQGASNKDIANRLNISESTVKVHVRAIMALKGASNRTQIVAHLLKGGDLES